MPLVYGKHFEKMYRGSMRGAGPYVFAVWGYVISHVKGDSIVEFNEEEVGFLIGMELERVREALKFLTAPDPKSRNEECEGRRMVQRGKFEYYVPSAAFYRGVRSMDDLREYNRIKQQESRARKKPKLSDGTEPPPGAPTREQLLVYVAEMRKNEADYTDKEALDVWLEFNANGWMWGKNPIIDWRSAVERRMGQNRSNNENDRRNRGGTAGKESSGHSKGTYNEKHVGDYSAENLKKIPNVIRPGPGGNAP